ncbi:hypothetical protein [Algoriphagus namhaensis]
MYLLLADPEQENIAGFFNYDLWFKAIYRLTGFEFGVLELRIFRLLLLFPGAFVLWRIVQRESRSVLNRFEIFVILFLGLALSYIFLPQSLSYNHLSIFFSTVWLYFFSDRKWNFKTFLGLGFCLTGLFYVKITSCLTLGLVTLVKVVIDLFRGELKLSDLFLLIAPMVFLESFFFFVLGDFGVSRVIAALELVSDRTEYSFLNLLKYTTVGLFWTGTVLIPFTLSGYIKKKSKCSMGIRFGALSLLFFVMHLTNTSGEITHFPALIILAFFSYQLGSSFRDGVSKTRLTLVLILFFMPFLIYFGSNFYFYRIATHYSVFWILGILLLISGQQTRVASARISLVAFSFGTIIFVGLWLYPSHTSSLFKNDRSWEFGNQSLLLDSSQVEILTSLEERLVEKEHSKTLFAFANPGFPYLLNLNIPNTPLIWNKEDLRSRISPEEIDVLFYNGFGDLPDSYRIFRLMDSIGNEQFRFKILTR